MFNDEYQRRLEENLVTAFLPTHVPNYEFPRSALMALTPSVISKYEKMMLPKKYKLTAEEEAKVNKPPMIITEIIPYVDEGKWKIYETASVDGGVWSSAFETSEFIPNFKDISSSSKKKKSIQQKTTTTKIYSFVYAGTKWETSEQLAICLDKGSPRSDEFITCAKSLKEQQHHKTPKNYSDTSLAIATSAKFRNPSYTQSKILMATGDKPLGTSNLILMRALLIAREYLKTAREPIIRPDYKPIALYKIVKDTTANRAKDSPKRRTQSVSKPYGGHVSYCPSKARPTLKVQPLRAVLVNEEIQTESLGGDTPEIRKVIFENMLTSALDWAAINNLPLPLPGTEIFFYAGDNANKAISSIGAPVALYSRTRKDSHLPMVPDYSFGCFTLGTRFVVNAGKCLTWDATKNVMLESPRASPPLYARDDKIFFKGAAFSYTEVREFLAKQSGKPVFANGKKLLAHNVLKVEIPSKRGDIVTAPMSLEDMGQFRYLLDLPGYGMWSTRLKYILLTRSAVIRVLSNTSTWNEETRKWSIPNPTDDTWETFTDGIIAPGEAGMHTIIATYYDPRKGKAVEAARLNIGENVRVLYAIARLHAEAEANKEAEQRMVDIARDKIATLSDARINQYMYKLIMNMSRIYHS